MLYTFKMIRIKGWKCNRLLFWSLRSRVFVRVVMKMIMQPSTLDDVTAQIAAFFAMTNQYQLDLRLYSTPLPFCVFSYFVEIS